MTCLLKRAAVSLLTLCLLVDSRVAAAPACSLSRRSDVHTLFSEEALTLLSRCTPKPLTRNPTRLLYQAAEHNRLAATEHVVLIPNYDQEFAEFSQAVDAAFQFQEDPHFESLPITGPHGEKARFESAPTTFFNILQRFRPEDFNGWALDVVGPRQQFFLVRTPADSQGYFNSFFLTTDPHEQLTSVAIRISSPLTKVEWAFKTVSDLDPRYLDYFRAVMKDFHRAPRRLSVKADDGRRLHLRVNWLTVDQINEFKRTAFLNPVLNHLLRRVARDAPGALRLTRLIHFSLLESNGYYVRSQTPQILWDPALVNSSGTIAHEITHFIHLWILNQNPEARRFIRERVTRLRYGMMHALIESHPVYVDDIEEGLDDAEVIQRGGVGTVHEQEVLARSVGTVARNSVIDSMSSYHLTVGDLRFLRQLDLISESMAADDALKGLADAVPLPRDFFENRKLERWTFRAVPSSVAELPIWAQDLQALKALVDAEHLKPRTLRRWVVRNGGQPLSQVPASIKDMRQRELWNLAFFVLAQESNGALHSAVSRLTHLLVRADRQVAEWVQTLSEPFPWRLIRDGFLAAGYTPSRLGEVWKPLRVGIKAELQRLSAVDYPMRTDFEIAAHHVDLIVSMAPFHPGFALRSMEDRLSRAKILRKTLEAQSA
jgi:hypothetical protein